MGSEKAVGKNGDAITWSNKMDFVMAAISAAIGLGNLWRFPYQCYRNGGGAFLLPFLLTIVVAGFPQVLSDLAMGQYGRSGAVRTYRAAPLVQGIGWCLVLLSLYVDVYYVVIVSYTVFYMFASFAKELPWDSCGNWWNTDDCRDTEALRLEKNCTSHNGTWLAKVCHVQPVLNGSIFINNTLIYEKPVDASEEYFNNYMLQLSSGITDIGVPRWPLVLCVLFTLLVVFITLSMGIKTWGKLAYVFALLPYIVLVALLVQSVLYEGAWEGIVYFLKPRWGEILNARVWVDAVGQAFFSLGCTGGSLITIGSFNRFRNNCFRDSVIVTLGDTLTCLFCGVVVFSILGLMAHDLEVSIDDVVGKGAGMTFVAYTSALARLPSAPVWSVVFMLMMFSLGVGTVVSVIATIQKALLEELPPSVQSKKSYQILLLIAVLGVFFLLGLIYTTNGGMYVVQMMDTYVSYVLLLVGLSKTLMVTWIYGINNLYDDIKTMSGYRPCQLLAWIHKFVTPVLLVFVIIFNFTSLKLLTYGDYVFPRWSEALGWSMTFALLLVIPGVAIYKMVKLPGNLPVIQRMKILCQPASDWKYKEDQIEGPVPGSSPERESFL